MANFTWSSLTLPQWYGLVELSMIITWQAIRVSRWIICRVLSPLALFAVRLFTRALRRVFPTCGLDGMTFTFLLTMFVANVLCLTFRLSNRNDLASRSGILATINLITLLMGTRLNDGAAFLGVSLRTYGILHASVSGITLAESGIHTMIVLINNMEWSSLKTWGAVVS